MHTLYKTNENKGIERKVSLEDILNKLNIIIYSTFFRVTIALCTNFTGTYKLF
jgi:hypothetical protein